MYRARYFNTCSGPPNGGFAYAAEIEAFLTHLAVERNVAASTQNQTFAAILFLYQKVLEIELPTIDALRAKRPKRLPVVLSVEEVRCVLAELDGIDLLQAELLYGTAFFHHRNARPYRFAKSVVDFFCNRAVRRER